MFKNALVSVSDKTGLVEFLRPLASKGLRIVSTGGTAEHLKAAGLPVVDLIDQTGFPEVMGGRVKTLHPRVHMALLNRGTDEDLALLKKENLAPFDLVIVNLYPFEETLCRVGQDSDESELVEKIDIGGPTLLRASAKNFERVTVVCDPSDYSVIQEKEMLTLLERKALAAKVFAHVACYDSMIARWFEATPGKKHSFGGRQVQVLRYGENPTQQAWWYAESGNKTGIHEAHILQGKELSYNNLLDLEAATQLVAAFDVPTVVAVKHNNPCGVAKDLDLSTAVQKALSADPVSVFGGIVAVNTEVHAEQAEMFAKVFLECVIAPKFSESAKKVFATKKNLRVLEWPLLTKARRGLEVRSLAGGFLVQNPQSLSSDFSSWKFLGEVPSPELIEDLKFAEIVCASLKSNAIAIVKGGQTLGLGMGQVNRVEAVQHAVTRMRSYHQDLKGAILASDAFFPFPDSIEKAAESGVRWVIQPGGSMRDQEVFEAAARLGVNMIITGERHFRH